MATPKGKKFLENNSRHPTTDELFNEGYEKAGLQPRGLGREQDTDQDTENDERARFIAETNEQLEQEAIDEEQLRRRAQIAATQQPKRRGAIAAVSVVRRGSIFLRIFPHLWVYLTFQLPLAFMSLAFLGIATAVSSTSLGQAVSAAASAVNYVASAAGLDLGIFGPESMFFTLHFLLYGFMMMYILFVVGYYGVVRREQALSGRGTEAKYGALLLCIMGYAVPLGNLFPWMALYVYIMHLYPGNATKA